MSQYDTLDALILAAIRGRRHPLYESTVSLEAARIAFATGRDDFRIVDGRLQAMRKSGLIVHLTKAEGGGSGGWKLAGEPFFDAVRPRGVAPSDGGQQ